jgi:hypothetical protein
MDIIQIISTLGFPIACCLGLGWYVKTQTDNYRNDVKDIQREHKEETKQMTDALNNNTLALQHLAEKIEQLDRKETA